MSTSSIHHQAILCSPLVPPTLTHQVDPQVSYSARLRRATLNLRTGVAVSGYGWGGVQGLGGVCVR